MLRYIMLFLTLSLCGHASAHQWTPTYPILQRSFVPNVWYTTLELFNSRRDVEFYQISVLDKDMNSIPFATRERIIKVPYTKKMKVDVYIRDEDKDRAVYVCSLSKLLPTKEAVTIVSSRICSKIK